MLGRGDNIDHALCNDSGAATSRYCLLTVRVRLIIKQLSRRSERKLSRLGYRVRITPPCDRHIRAAACAEQVAASGTPSPKNIAVRR